MTQHAYVHIPFCKNKCKYCSFVSYSGVSKPEQKEYVKTLLAEIEHYYKNEPLKTLYIGGGTPSLLDICDLKKIIHSFKYMQNAEVTIEVNPETVETEYLYELRLAGFNRISIGIQSFDDKILKLIGRIHNAKTAKETVISAQKAGFKNINVDFIYGLPNQSCESFINDLKTAAQLNVEHISLYGLKIEENCYFFKYPPQNIADDDEQADMYLSAITELERKNFNHYEISNFAKTGFESRHNLNYWDNGEYYGFGAAAHGHIKEVRYSNYTDLQTYLKNYNTKEYKETLNKQEQLEETIFLGFRKSTGINIKEINNKFLIDFEVLYKNILKKYTKSGHLLKTVNGYKLSNKGYLLSNIILSDFMNC